MNSNLENYAIKLHDLIENSKEVLDLKEAEKNISDDPDLVNLLTEYSALQETLSKALEVVTIDDVSLKQNRIKLSELKYQIDIHPSIKNYNQIYKKVSEIYSQIGNEIFADFRNLKECKCA